VLEVRQAVPLQANHPELERQSQVAHQARREQGMERVRE